MNDTRYRFDQEPIQVSEDIVPLGEFRTHAARVLRKLRASHRPVVITQNGRPAGVLVSPEAFDRLQEKERFVMAGGGDQADDENDRGRNSE